MERKQYEMEMASRQQLEANRQIINKAAKKEDEPVDIDDIVGGLFDFLPSDPDSNAPPPSAFRVRWCFIDFVESGLSICTFFFLIRIFRNVRAM